MIETYRARKREEARNAQVASLSAEMGVTASALGMTGSDVARDNIVSGNPVMGATAMYVATVNIARGERLVENINVRKTNLAEYIIEQSKSKE